MHPPFRPIVSFHFMPVVNSRSFALPSTNKPRHSLNSTQVNPTHWTMRAALGTRPASRRVLPKSTEPSKVLRGKFMTKREAATPSSVSSLCASSKSVVSAGSVFITLPPAVCRRSRASVCCAAVFGAAAGAAADVEVEGSGAAALPSRAALASSAFRRRSSLSASIFALILRFASWSSSFSCRLRAASLICSLRAISSFRSCVSLVAF